MHIILLYDITDDRIRFKIANACQDYGLDRTQFSAFIGELSRTHQEELTLKVQTLLGDRPGSVLIVPVNGPEWARRWELRNLPEGEEGGVASDDLAPTAQTPHLRTLSPPLDPADEPF
jgi:CRISPR-associated protein Cas2